jgi:hypothetical protein
MRFIRPTITNQRLQRFHRWALLWLTWFAAFLDQAAAYAPLTRQAKAAAHTCLDLIERIVLGIAMVRACQHVRVTQHAKAWRERDLVCKSTAMRRAIIGAKLRRALRPRDVRQRIAALSQGMGSFVAAILRRAPRGLTRRSQIAARPRAIVEDIFSALAPSALLSTDTS